MSAATTWYNAQLPSTTGKPIKYPPVTDSGHVGGDAEIEAAFSAVIAAITALNVDDTDMNNNRLVLGQNGFISRRLPFDHFWDTDVGSGTIPNAAEVTRVNNLCTFDDGGRPGDYQRFNTTTGGWLADGEGMFGKNPGEANGTHCKALYSQTCDQHAKKCQVGYPGLGPSGEVPDYSDYPTGSKSNGTADIKVDNSDGRICGSDVFPTQNKLNVSVVVSGREVPRNQAFNYPLDCACNNSMIGENWNDDYNVFDINVRERKPRMFDKMCKEQINMTGGGQGWVDDRNITSTIICNNSFHFDDLNIGNDLIIQNIEMSNTCGEEETYDAPTQAPGTGGGTPSPSPGGEDEDKDKDKDSKRKKQMMIFAFVVLLVVVLSAEN
jgi:hypothetical protein